MALGLAFTIAVVLAVVGVAGMLGAAFFLVKQARERDRQARQADGSGAPHLPRSD